MNTFSYKDAILNKNKKKIITNKVRKEDIKQNVEIKKEEDIKQNVEITKEDIKQNVEIKKKINIYTINVEKNSIPSKEIILKLCSYGSYKKISYINKSHFDDDNVKFYLTFMKNKIMEIKKWKKEEKNNNIEMKKRFKARIEDIYRSMSLIKRLNKLSKEMNEIEIEKENKNYDDLEKEFENCYIPNSI